TDGGHCLLPQRGLDALQVATEAVRQSVGVGVAAGEVTEDVGVLAYELHPYGATGFPPCSQYLHGGGVEVDDAGLAGFGGADDGGSLAGGEDDPDGPFDAEGGPVEVDVRPADADEFAASEAGVDEDVPAFPQVAILTGPGEEHPGLLGGPG